MNEEEYLRQVILSPYPKDTGKMTTGQLVSGIELFCPITKFKIGITSSRASFDNRDICIAMYKEYLNKYIL